MKKGNFPHFIYIALFPISDGYKHGPGEGVQVPPHYPPPWYQMQQLGLNAPMMAGVGGEGYGYPPPFLHSPYQPVSPTPPEPSPSPPSISPSPASAASPASSSASRALVQPSAVHYERADRYGRKQEPSVKEGATTPPPHIPSFDAADGGMGYPSPVYPGPDGHLYYYYPPPPQYNPATQGSHLHEAYSAPAVPLYSMVCPLLNPYDYKESMFMSSNPGLFLTARSAWTVSWFCRSRRGARVYALSHVPATATRVLLRSQSLSSEQEQYAESQWSTIVEQCRTLREHE